MTDDLKLRIVCGDCLRIAEIAPAAIMFDPECCGKHMLIAGAIKTDRRTGRRVDPVDNLRPINEQRQVPLKLMGSLPCRLTAGEMRGSDLMIWRTTHGYSQYQLATAIGVNRSSVTRWENAAKIPREKIRAILNLERNFSIAA